MRTLFKIFYDELNKRNIYKNFYQVKKISWYILKKQFYKIKRQA